LHRHPPTRAHVDTQYNIFGRTFEDVLLAPDSEVRWDDSRQNFDTSVVYVHK
jgi:hypothetical protein